jgi:hypothetical protein
MSCREKKVPLRDGFRTVTAAPSEVDRATTSRVDGATTSGVGRTLLSDAFDLS